MRICGPSPVFFRHLTRRLAEEAARGGRDGEGSDDGSETHGDCKRDDWLLLERRVLFWVMEREERMRVVLMRGYPR